MSPNLTSANGFRRPGAKAVTLVLLLAISLAALTMTGLLYAQHERSRAADRLFLRMVTTDDEPWRVPASRAAARAIIDGYPDSRWASEAWRVIALDAESRCDTATAVTGWASFAEVFPETHGQGIAYGHLNVARLHESEGATHAADRHYRTALHAIASSESRTQTWIAIDAARSMARIRRGAGQWAETTAWEMRADRLARANEQNSMEEAHQ